MQEVKMLRLKITTDKTVVMDEVESITKLTDLANKKIDYAYSSVDDDNPGYNYFEIQVNGMKKILAVAGKVEQWEVPDTAQKIKTWDQSGG
jgi:hypothetical protein